MTDVGHTPPSPSMRLIFEYDGDDVRLVMQQPVDMLITGFDIARTQRPGYYVDTRDAAGRTLARVPARGGFHTGVEVFPEKHGDPITHIEVDQPRGAFTVVVPVPQDADHVSVVRVAPQPAPDAASPEARAAAGAPQERELARFPLRVSR